MSQPLPPVLPACLARLIDDDELTEDGVAFQLVTVRPDGWPHLSMISVGEIVTTGERGLKLALWPGSNATANASSTGRATLTTVVDGVPYSLRLSLTGPTAITSPTYGRIAAFGARIEEVRADVAPYAEVETGIRFRLRAPAEVLPRWAETRALLSQTTF
jgi:hypothetical protein